jgi:hypothetical protein
VEGFSTLGASRRGDLLALRISTGELLPWAPDASRDRAEVAFGNVFLHASCLTSLAVDAERVLRGAALLRVGGGHGCRGDLRVLARDRREALGAHPCIGP